MIDTHLWNPAWGPDMSGPRDLTRDKAVRSDMSGLTLWNPDKEPDKAGWDLAVEELGLGRTYLGWEPDMSGKWLWNPAKEPDKLG
jgi:hypothetical protein